MDFKSGDEETMGLDLDMQDSVEDTAPAAKSAKKPEKAVEMKSQDKGSEELVAEAAGEAMEMAEEAAENAMQKAGELMEEGQSAAEELADEAQQKADQTMEN